MEVGKEELYVVISTLVGVIGVLWGLTIKNFKQKEKALEDKENDHKECLDKVTELTAKVSYLEGKTEGIATLATTLIDKLDTISTEIKDLKQPTD